MLGFLECPTLNSSRVLLEPLLVFRQVGWMKQPSYVELMFLEVRPKASTECWYGLEAEPGCVVLDLAQQRIATIMKHATNSARRMVMVEPGISLRTR